MLKDHKDEMIVMLKRKNADMEEQLKQLGKVNLDFKKGDNLAEQKIKALEEMHAQKIKTLLKSIQILKKEVQKEKFEKKDNIRAQKIEALNRDIQYCEVAINALRKVVNSEDRCDQAIKQELDKGPKRIRVASREELKMDINKYKNMTLRLLEILKQNGIKQPAGYKIDAGAGTGLKEEKGNLGGFDINNMSAAGSVAGDDAGGNGGEGDLGMNDQELLEEKNRLEETVVKLNLELKDKNESMLELLDEIEEIKIQVYARDKSIELQQKQIEDLLEELRDSKTVDNDIKILVSKKIAIEEENNRLKKELDEKFVNNQDKVFEQQQLAIDNKTLVEQIRVLSQELDKEKLKEQQQRSKLDAEKMQLQTEIATLTKTLEITKREVSVLKVQNTDMQNRLNLVDGQVQGALSRKDEDLDSYRKQLLEFEKQLKLKDEQISELQTKVIAISHELSEKDMELEFYANSLDEAKMETDKIRSQLASSGSGQAGKPQVSGSGETVDINEFNNLKAKWRLLMRREVELQEEIDRLKQDYQTETNAKSIKNILDRSKSRGRQENNPAVANVQNNASSAGLNITQQNKIPK